MKYSRKTFIIGFGLLLVGSLIVCIIFLPSWHKRPVPQESQAQKLQEFFDHSPMVLNSREKYGAVHIPFTIRDEIIRVRMTWSGKPVEAILDTGSGFITWPQSLNLMCWKSGIRQDSAMAESVVTHGEWTVLPLIKAGNCEWQQIPTVADGVIEQRTAPQSKTQTLKTLNAPEPLLGAPAFQRVVLTIDYQKKEFVVRGSEYDITHLPHHHYDILLSPEWENGYLPLVQGTLNGHPARFALDTGCATVPVSSKFVKRWPTETSQYAATTTINGAKVSLTGLKYISGSVAGKKFQEYGAQVIDLPSQADALFGTAFLSRYRVTIDYTRHKVLLEPYSEKT